MKCEELKIMKPQTIVTSDRWCQFPMVVFEDEKLIGRVILTDWIDDEIEMLGGDYDDLTATRSGIEADMIENFFAENDSVDEYWADHMICRSGRSYYRYDEDGMAEYIGEFDSIEEATKE